MSYRVWIRLSYGARDWLLLSPRFATPEEAHQFAEWNYSDTDTRIVKE